MSINAEISANHQINLEGTKNIATKKRPILDYIQSNLFVLTEDFSHCKRKGKYDQLQVESIDYNVYAVNKCVVLRWKTP